MKTSKTKPNQQSRMLFAKTKYAYQFNQFQHNQHKNKIKAKFKFKIKTKSHLKMFKKKPIYSSELGKL